MMLGGLWGLFYVPDVRADLRQKVTSATTHKGLQDQSSNLRKKTQIYEIKNTTPLSDDVMMTNNIT